MVMVNDLDHRHLHITSSDPDPDDSKTGGKTSFPSFKFCPDIVDEEGVTASELLCGRGSLGGRWVSHASRSRCLCTVFSDSNSDEQQIYKRELFVYCLTIA